MVTVPGFLLRRLYVKQSLRNTCSGFRFELMNRLGSGYAHKVHPVTVDGLEASMADSEFVLDGCITGFMDVSVERTFTLALNRSIIVRVNGSPLEPGTRKIGMAFDVPGLGTLRFDFTDNVAEA